MIKQKKQVRFLCNALAIVAICFAFNLSVADELDSEVGLPDGEQIFSDGRISFCYNNEFFDDGKCGDSWLVEARSKDERNERVAESKGMVYRSMKPGISSEVNHENIERRKKSDALILIPLMFFAALLAFVGMWAGYRIQPMTYSWIDLIDVSPFSQVCGRIATMIVGGVIGGVLGCAIWLYVQVNVL